MSEEEAISGSSGNKVPFISAADKSCDPPPARLSVKIIDTNDDQ